MFKFLKVKGVRIKVLSVGQRGWGVDGWGCRGFSKEAVKRGQGSL
jgi:hypothetical protein